MNPSKRFPESSRWGKSCGRGFFFFLLRWANDSIFGPHRWCLPGIHVSSGKDRDLPLSGEVWGALKVLHRAEAKEGRRQNKGGRLAVSEKEEGQERKMREQREEGEEQRVGKRKREGKMTESPS